MLKKAMSKLILGFSLYLFLFCINVNYVYAKDIVTTTIDLTTLSTTTDKMEAEGWYWDATSKTLTLDGVTIEITDTDDSANDCIKFNRGENITIIFKGENNLKADKGYSLYGVYTDGDGTLTLKGEENAILNLSYKRFKSTYRGNNGTTIGYPHNLVIESGTINSKGTIMVDDTFTMNGGDFNLESFDTDDSGIYAIQQVKVTGGNLNVVSKGTAIMVPGSRSESDKADGVVIDGGNVSLDSKEGQGIYAGHPSSTPDGDYTKNVIINGGNITLSSEYGIYVRKGKITITNIDSADVSNVREDVLKVYNMAGNEIICPEADYSQVNNAIAKANALNKDDYIDFSAVINAINAVVKNKSILEQSEVDTMANNIINAIANLSLKYEPKPQEPDDSDVLDEENDNSDTPDKETDKSNIPDKDRDNVDNPDTYDSVSKDIIYFTLSIVGLGFSIFLYKKESTNY